MLTFFLFRAFFVSRVCCIVYGFELKFWGVTRFDTGLNKPLLMFEGSLWGIYFSAKSLFEALKISLVLIIASGKITHMHTYTHIHMYTPTHMGVHRAH